jgi:predicted nucleotide-binding protein
MDGQPQDLQAGAPPSAFIIHGRETQLKDALKAFLISLGIEPVDFDAVRARLAGAVTVDRVVQEGMHRTDFVIALFDPEDYSSLAPRFRGAVPTPDDVRWQPRPNVIFEAGIAFGQNPSRILIVRTCALPPFSDLSGVHFIGLTNDRSGRETLKNTILATLTKVGCSVPAHGNGWETAGDFDCGCPPWTPLDPFGGPFWRTWFSTTGTGLLASLSVFFLAALVGGLAWTFLWNALGGEGNEPHGWAAILWPFVTLTPVVAAVVLAGRYFRGDPWRMGWRHLWFVVAAVVGSWCFYDIPIAGAHGFRDLLSGVPFLAKERFLVVLWGLSLSVLSLLPIGVPARIRRPRHMLYPYVVRVLIVVLTTALPVIAFVQIFPSAQYESARGILAGILLRTGLSIALFMRRSQ